MQKKHLAGPTGTDHAARGHEHGHGHGHDHGRDSRAPSAGAQIHGAPLPGCACGCGSPVVGIMHDRVMADISRRAMLGGMAAAMAPFAGLGVRGARAAQPGAPGRPLLLTNLRLFDGSGGPLRDDVQILVEGKRITALPGIDETVADAQVIDCGGRLAMPGLIDAHWHAMLCGITYAAAMTADVAYLHLVASKTAGDTLMRGFTTVRDCGGPTFALKRAIDEGLIDGPRIYPAGAMISQTSGHGDFRMRHEVPRGSADPLSVAERAGLSAIADGEAEVLRRVREQLMLGAAHVKMMAGGGVTSSYDPIDTLQFTERELRAGVDAASDWGTYVMVHVYTAPGIQRAIRAGVRSIEHGQLADEEAVRMMAGEGTWWSLQPFFGDGDANVKSHVDGIAKQKLVAEGTVRAYEMQKQFGVRTAWGSDILFSPQNLPNHARNLTKLTRFYDPLELLGIATGQNGEICAMSGPRNPYDGRIGRIEPEAFADILIADGDPGESLDFLLDPEANLRIIMKDGRIHKNTLG